MFEHVLHAHSNVQQYHSGLMALHKDLTFYFFHKNSAEVHLTSRTSQRKVKNKHVSGRKNVLGSL